VLELKIPRLRVRAAERVGHERKSPETMPANGRRTVCCVRKFYRPREKRYRIQKKAVTLDKPVRESNMLSKPSLVIAETISKQSRSSHKLISSSGPASIEMGLNLNSRTRHICYTPAAGHGPQHIFASTTL
jgi:hypothetical protein